MPGREIHYVSEKALVGMKEVLARAQRELLPFIRQITSPMMHVPNEEVMLPVNLLGVGVHYGPYGVQQYGSITELVSEFGIFNASQAFVNARGYFEANYDEEPVDARARPMIAREWKLDQIDPPVDEDESLLEEGGEESLLEEGEEESLLEGARRRSPSR